MQDYGIQTRDTSIRVYAALALLGILLQIGGLLVIVRGLIVLPIEAVRQQATVGSTLFTIGLVLQAFLCVPHLRTVNSIAQSTTRDTEQWWNPIVVFFMHILVGTAIFMLVAAVGIALNLFVHWLKVQYPQVDSSITYGINFFEYAIFIADGFLFLVFLIRTVYTTSKKLWKIE